MTMSKKRIAIIISAIIVIVIGMVWYQTNYSNTVNANSESIAENDQSKFEVDHNLFQQIKDTQTLVLTDKNDVFNIEEGKYYVYFTKKDCPFCEMLESIIEYYAANFNDPKLYFVDGDQCDGLNIFVKEDEESNNISGYTLPGVPSMLVVENGELKTSLSGAEPINEELKKEALNS